jgi:primase-polymerase (primpol)-like protein
MEAGVIAGVVFEDNIRRIYRNKIADDDKDKNLEELINALARKGVITGQQGKQAKLAAHVRSKATHALWDEFDVHGVQDTIQVTRRFLSDHLGG